MKKMTLVEKALLDRIREKQTVQAIAQPELSGMVQIQHQIEETLKSSKLSDDEKVNILQRAQQRFGQLKDSIQPRAAAAEPQPQPEPQGEPAAPQSSASLLGYAQIPAQYKNKVSKLEEYLKAHPGLIEKNEENEAIIEGKVIPGSDYSHLIRNLYVSKQDKNLTGLTSLLNVLKKVHLPPKLLSNPLFITQLTGKFPPYPETSKISPHHAPPAKRPRVPHATPSKPAKTLAR